MHDEHLYQSPAIGHYRLQLSLLRVPCWFFCNLGLKNCWQGWKFGPTTLDLNSLPGSGTSFRVSYLHYQTWTKNFWQKQLILEFLRQNITLEYYQVRCIGRSQPEVETMSEEGMLGEAQKSQWSFTQ